MPRDSTQEPEPDANDHLRVIRSLWDPYPGQQVIMANGARFRIVSAGRRWGKSEMCAHLALRRALEHPGSLIWWVSPTYDDANEYGFNKTIPLLSPDVVNGSPKRSKPRKIEFVNGSSISYRSADREDSLRGAGVDLLIIDESGAVPDRAWIEELRPTLSDTLGDMVAIGTPKGRNWFYRWFQRGQSEDHPDVASWQAPTYQNPHVPDEEIDAAADDMPQRAFEQEYLAKFIDDVGGVFDGVREHVEEYDLPVPPSDESAYTIGVDFARLENYTAIVVLDADGRLVAFDRLTETTWNRIQGRVEALADEYAPNLIAVDATRDNKIVGDLQAAGLSVKPVNFSAKKQVLIDNLAMSLENGDLTLSADAPMLVNELEVFEYDITDGGTVRYHAPSGFHDDTVDALALAVTHLPQVSRTTSGRSSDDGKRDTGVAYI